MPPPVDPDAGRRLATIAKRARRLALGIASIAFSPFLFRLSVGKWPDRHKNRQFAAALCDNSLQIPATLRALIAVAAARQQVSHMISFHLMGQGLLPTNIEGGIPPFSGNALHFWRDQPVSFLHFERTGGTTLAAALTDLFHPLQIAGTHGPNDMLHPNAALGAVTPEFIADAKLIWGHYDMPALGRLGPERRIITILREPVARIVSLYYFWRSIHPSQLGDVSDTRVMAAQELDLLGFLHSDLQPLRDSIDNVYVRRLAGLYGGATAHDPLAQDPEGAVRRAIESLDNIVFVGISEYMPESFRGMEKVLGISLGLSQRLNDAAANPTHHPTLFQAVERQAMTPEIQATLAHLTRLDTIVYEACRKRLMVKT